MHAREMAASEVGLVSASHTRTQGLYMQAANHRHVNFHLAIHSDDHGELSAACHFLDGASFHCTQASIMYAGKPSQLQVDGPSGAQIGGMVQPTDTCIGLPCKKLELELLLPTPNCA
eukprot:TRINITY_DN11416_c4_g12_i1.p3 TRINITY_DN11416_c4_g12~~TRINITY_DN11416_c4_g12_i1.p3  ORF type:complete len:117 (+),score=14.21 TRINITY_DN11416_c4_g12_i1:1148-1498(+)